VDEVCVKVTFLTRTVGRLIIGVQVRREVVDQQTLVIEIEEQNQVRMALNENALALLQSNC
jgi:hypothetical protein